MVSGIYKMTCLPNGKIYIGSSEDVDKRIKVHFRRLKNNNHTNPHLQNAYNLYGANEFSLMVLEECERESLLEREQYWMDLTQCYNRKIGFNNCKKSDRPTGYKHTDHAKYKMRQAKLGKKLPQKQIAKMVESRKGFKHSKETKDKISKANGGINNGMFGRKEDEDHKKERMKNFLAKPRWNKGLTKNSDERIKKLGVRAGKIPPNALKCELIDRRIDKRYSGYSLKDLAEKSGLSLSSINRIKFDTCGRKLKDRYILNIL